MLVPLNKKSKKVMGGKKLSDNVLVVPFDNVPLHYEETMLTWKYVYHKRISPKRELSKDVFKCYEIMELLEDAQVKKIMSNIGHFYPNLVKEFIVNLPIGFNDAGSSNFRKVYVRGHYFGFSPCIINDYLGRGKIITIDCIPYLKIIA